jgi:hypothetical protein
MGDSLSRHKPGNTGDFPLRRSAKDKVLDHAILSLYLHSRHYQANRSTYLLGNLIKSRDQRRVNGMSPLLVECNNLSSLVGDTLGGQAELGVNLVIRTGSTPCLETEVFVG